ncbi:MAG: hypothetical protein AAFR17_02230 [Pseudomonadota bacterium]
MKAFVAASVICVLGACSAADFASQRQQLFGPEGWPETRRLDRPIAPVTRPMLRRLSSMKVENLLTGEQERIKVSRFGQGVRVREADGCIWTRAGDWFAPSDSFAACGTSKNWHTAQARISRSGSLFPMRIGKRAVYERDAVSWNGRTSSRQTACEVTDTAEVLRPGGRATPAFVVTCDDGRVARTTWYAPSKGPIAYHEERAGKGVRDAWIRLD